MVGDTAFVGGARLMTFSSGPWAVSPVLRCTHHENQKFKYGCIVDIASGDFWTGRAQILGNFWIVDTRKKECFGVRYHDWYWVDYEELIVSRTHKTEESILQFRSIKPVPERKLETIIAEHDRFSGFWAMLPPTRAYKSVPNRKHINHVLENHEVWLAMIELAGGLYA